MQRTVIAILAVLLLAVGGVLQFGAITAQAMPGLAASCLRMGAILGVLWLALPEVLRPRTAWALAGLVVGVFLVARSPKLILLLPAVAVAFWILRPRIRSWASGRGP